MNMELMEALDILEKEKNISKDTLLEAIEQSLIQACKNHFGKADNVIVNINPKTCDFGVFAEKTVVEQVEDPVMEISLAEAQKLNGKMDLGDIVRVEIKSKQFGRIATQNAKNVILQKIREEERKALFDQYYCKEKDVVTGIVQRYFGKNVSVNLGKVDAVLNESEQIKGEVFQPTERIKVYILEVRDAPKGPKILVSRTHPELVKRLFESEVTEVKEGIVEIKSIAREAGSRSKIAVWSNDPDVDPVGSCVGMNGARVNAVVHELRGEKIDIINWSDNPALLIENALSPAKVIAVLADPDEKTALVVVPDYQLSLAIGKEGQNARLAARLTGFKIDIKSETQARESGELYEYEEMGEEEMSPENEDEIPLEAAGEAYADLNGEAAEDASEALYTARGEDILEDRPGEMDADDPGQEDACMDNLEEEPGKADLDGFEEEIKTEPGEADADDSAAEDEPEEADTDDHTEPEELSDDGFGDEEYDDLDDIDEIDEEFLDPMEEPYMGDSYMASDPYADEQGEFDPESDLMDLALLGLEEGGFEFEE